MSQNPNLQAGGNYNAGTTPAGKISNLDHLETLMQKPLVQNPKFSARHAGLDELIMKLGRILRNCKIINDRL